MIVASPPRSLVNPIQSLDCGHAQSINVVFVVVVVVVVVTLLISARKAHRVGWGVDGELGYKFGARSGKGRGKGLQQAPGEELHGANDQIPALAQKCVLLCFSLQTR
jgi:hypothetical protein